MRIKNFLLLATVTLFAFTSCQDNKKEDKTNDMNATDNTEMNEPSDESNGMATDTETEPPMENNSVADVIKGSEKHATLLKAMDEAGIIVKLSGTDEYTVFAPTNAAFDELPKGTIADLMKPENSEKLEGILSYHIVPGNVDSAKLTDLIKSSENGKYELVTANDGKLTASINKAGNVILTDAAGGEATVVAADMTASNGVVHSINSVLMRK